MQTECFSAPVPGEGKDGNRCSAQPKRWMHSYVVTHSDGAFGRETRFPVFGSLMYRRRFHTSRPTYSSCSGFRCREQACRESCWDSRQRRPVPDNALRSVPSQYLARSPVRHVGAQECSLKTHGKTSGRVFDRCGRAPWARYRTSSRSKETTNVGTGARLAVFIPSRRRRCPSAPSEVGASNSTLAQLVSRRALTLSAGIAALIPDRRRRRMRDPKQLE